MDDRFAPNRAATAHRDRPTRHARPDRFAFWAVVMAVAAMFAGVATADGADGGIGIDGDTRSETTSGDGKNDTSDARQKRARRYRRIWRRYGTRAKRWARRTSRCESGGDPKAIGGGGRYRGAFQFTRPTWRNSPRSPGGDPIRYRWRTQAVVAVSLKRRDGAGHWPVCG